MIKNNIKMQLSIIIVHYKNQEKLLQCLNSINNDKIEKEIILIDNNSNDNIDRKLNKYDNITYIKNKENIGFSKACNQGVVKSTGKYILFLNPDTIIPEETLEYCLKRRAVPCSQRRELAVNQINAEDWRHTDDGHLILDTPEKENLYVYQYSH